MPTARPFAYNPGSPIAGTEQVGDIAVGTTPQNYSGGYGGVRWWNGPDEDLGYIICYSVPTEDHPSPDGPIAGVGFFRSKFLTEPSFIEIAEYVSNGQTFATGNDAKIWLNANGYWTSWQEPANGILTRAVGAFETVTGSTIVTFSSSTFSISGSSYLPVFDGESKEFSHGDIEIGDTLTIGLTGTPFYTVSLTKNSTTFLQQSFWYTPETGVTFNTGVSTGDTLTVSVAVRVYEYENSGTGSSAIQACSSYPTVSSSKYSVFPWGNWGSEAYIFNDGQFTSPFTSSYVANIGFGTSTVYWKETDSNGKVISQGTCPSSTTTPTPTPTITPTPSTTPSSSNLLVYLDSGNPSSYPGTGDTWFDLEGTSNNATLFNSPTYSSSYQGILQFDDASLEYATIPNLGDLNQWTVEAWFRLSSPLTGKVTSIISNQFDLVDKLNFSIGTNNAPTNTNLAVGYYDGAWRTTTGVVPQVGVWYQVVGTYDGSVIRQYINGVASGGTVNYVGTPESGGEVRLMRRWDLTPISSNLVDGDLAIIKIYNSALNASEVLSNYNSTYTRFLDITPTPTVTSTPTTTPTPTTTLTETPTNTPTPSPVPTFTIINNSTGDRTVTNVFGGMGLWTLSNGSYPISAGQSANGFSHPSLTNEGLDQLVVQFGGTNAIDISITKNGLPYTPSSSPSPTNVTASQINYFINGPSDFIQVNDIIVFTITDTI